MAEFLAPRHEVPTPFLPEIRPLAAPPTLAPRARSAAAPAQTSAPIAEASAPAAAPPAPASARPTGAPSASPHDPAKPAVKRQIVCFSFYKVQPEWRRLPAAEKSAHKAAF